MAKGRIKACEGTLIGNAGEYYAVAELLKRGVGQIPDSSVVKWRLNDERTDDP